MDYITMQQAISGTRRLSMRIGNARTLDEVDGNALRLAACEVHISERIALKQLNNILNRFEISLAETAVELSESGFQKAEELKERILRTGGCRKFL